nr:hypothetical protein [Tanacetum cinerariifolium]
MVAILEKTKHNTDFHQIVDFLEASHIRYALTISPTIYVSHIRQFWSTARIETTDQETKIIAIVDAPTKTLTPRRLTKRAIWIAQSKALSPDADKHVSLLRDDRHGKAFPTVSSLDARQDKENIARTFTMFHELSPRVPSLDADEGSMHQRLHELMELCTSLQRQQSQMADKIKDQYIEISRLKARVKSLEDKERRREEPIQKDAPITGGIIDIGEELGADKSTEKGSNDTEEVVNVLSSMEAANIVKWSGGAATASVSSADVFPTTGVPTVSESFPTVSVIFTIASVATPYARRSNEVIAKHLSEDEQAEADLSVGEKIKLISDLVKYQDHLAEILKYQSQQSKPSSKKEQRRFYMFVLKSHAG